MLVAKLWPSPRTGSGFQEDSTRLLIVVVGVWGVVGGTILLLDSLKLRELVSRARS